MKTRDCFKTAVHRSFWYIYNFRTNCEQTDQCLLSSVSEFFEKILVILCSLLIVKLSGIAASFILNWRSLEIFFGAILMPRFF